MPLSTLVGREREIDVVCSLLMRPEVRLVTLTGPGGVGKTRLALAVANVLAGVFADGVAFVSLAAIRAPGLVPAAIAQVLEVREAAGRTIVDSIANIIGEEQVLLVLDNFEQVLEAAPVINTLLVACPRLVVLVTSRAGLHLSGEHLVLVPPLPLPDGALPLHQLRQVDAVRLFVERARSAKNDFALTDANASVVSSICTRLDGLPLAIELAAARVRMLSPKALLAHLDHRLQLLAGGPRDQPARLQTMRNTITWSYDLLRPDQQQVFRRLAVFAGGCTLEMAESVCEGDLDVLDGLSALVDHSLVGQVEQPDGSTRFGMLETVREYALEQLEASGESAAIRARHANAYLSLVEAEYPCMGESEGSGDRYVYHFTTGSNIGVQEIRDWFARMEPEQHNLRAALAWLLDTRADALALRLAALLGTFWCYKSHLSEGSAWLERALTHGEKTPVHLRASAQFSAGCLALHRGDYELGLVHFEESLALWQKVPDEVGVLEAKLGLAFIAEAQTDDARAIRLYEEVLNRARGKSDELVAMTLVNLGEAAYRQGELDRATALAEDALAVRPQQPVTRTFALCGVAQAALERGEHERAARLYADVLNMGEHFQYLFGSATALAGLAGVAAAAGQPTSAARLLGAVAIIMERQGMALLASSVQHQRALAATRAALSPEAFEQGWAEGRVLPIAAVMAEALALATPTQAPLPAATPPAKDRHGLTARELQVLQLIVEGLSDREVAVQLYISPHTVMRHVASILGKLEVSSRTAAATRAVRQGIV